MTKRLTPEREADIRSKYSCTWPGQEELLAEIDGLRTDLITKEYELEAMNSIGHERIVRLEKELEVANAWRMENLASAQFLTLENAMLSAEIERLKK